MGHLDHASFGLLTPALSYAMAVIGAALGLRCTVRALATSGRSRRNWLITAASAIGTGIWTMHFVAMLGFSVRGTDIRYNVPLTILSLLVAMLVVGAGVFCVGYGRDRVRSLLIGGLTTGLGVASMHYLGMAALKLHGSVHYDPLLVALSVAIAVVAATAALWAALNIKSPIAVVGASLLMGAAVSSMHYTGMMAVGVHIVPSGGDLSGATTMQFIFPSRSVSGPISSSPPPLSRSLRRPTNALPTPSPSSRSSRPTGILQTGRPTSPQPRVIRRRSVSRLLPVRPSHRPPPPPPSCPIPRLSHHQPRTRNEEAMRTPRRNQGAAPPPHPLPPSSAKPPRGRRAHAGPPAVEHTGHEPRPDGAPQPPAGSGTANGGRLLRPRTVRAKIISF